MVSLKTALANSANVENVNGTGRFTQDGIYGSIHVHDASAAQTIPTGATYTKITAYTDDGLSSNVTNDAANDKITITKTGKYLVSGSFSFLSGTANVVFFLTSFLNGVEQEHIYLKRKISTAGDVGSASFSGFINASTAPWDLDVRVRHDNGGDVALTIAYSNLAIMYVGE